MARILTTMMRPRDQNSETHLSDPNYTLPLLSPRGHDSAPRPAHGHGGPSLPCLTFSHRGKRPVGPKSRETHLSVELGCVGQLRGQTRASGEENGELPGAGREQPRRVTRPGFPVRPDGTAIFTEGSSGTSPPQRGKFENHAGRRDLGRASRGKARNGRAPAVGCSQSQLPPPPTAI